MNKQSQIKVYDVLIVGAGIQGAGIAQASAENGWKTLVVERNANAGMETSRNSSKLIHGGLRYLETMQFGLVYECLSARRALLKLAPNLVKLKPFYIPVYNGVGRSYGWIFLGLTLYCLLGGARVENRFTIVPKKRWQSLGIKTTGLKAVFQYFDAQTDDQELTHLVIDRAKKLSADVVYNTQVLSATLSDSGGYHVSLSNGEQVQCNVFINAAGPWVNDVAAKVESAPVGNLEWVQGSHIVLDVSLSQQVSNANEVEEACFYFESPIDGRAFFVLPWKGKLMIGTTEVLLDHPCAKITDQEIEYLLASYNAYFPDFVCTKEDICGTYSGVRVLPSNGAKGAPNKRSRETIFLHHKTRSTHYLAVYGGKLTSYRITADKVIATLKQTLLSNNH